MLDSAKARAIWAFCGLIFGNFLRRGINPRLAGFDAPFRISPRRSRHPPPFRISAAIHDIPPPFTTFPRHIPTLPRHIPALPRHSREGGNPEGSGMRRRTRRNAAAQASRRNQGSHGAASPPVIPAKAGIQRAGAGCGAKARREEMWGARASRQNQDLRDYRIFRILPAGLRPAGAHPYSYWRDLGLVTDR